MKNLLLGMAAFSTMLLFTACGKGTGSGSENDSDSVHVTVIDSVPLPDTAYASVNDLNWKVFVEDSASDGQLSDYTDWYKDAPGTLCFRDNAMRTADFGGTVKGTPKTIVVDWQFETDQDWSKTKLGSWGGGTGWTGQPLYVEWPDSIVKKFKATPTAKLTADFGPKEIILSSLCAKTYFINFETGKASREPLDVGNPIKGTMSLDPRMNGNLYIGQGIESHEPVGQIAANLFTHERFFFNPGFNDHANRHWPASDSSPLYVGGYLFWPSEDGLINKYDVRDGKMKLHSCLQYTAKGDHGAGVESSMCIYKNYGFVGDNHGDVLCINLNTMKPVWHYDNVDDIDGSIVCKVENGVPYIYTACEVDLQGSTGNCHFAKLNGLNGQQVWAYDIPCTRMNNGTKHFDGGMYTSPLLGKGNCEGMIFFALCNDHGNGHGSLYAYNTKTGQQIYQVPLKHYAWSSPVAFYNERNELYLLICDTNGRMYLFNAKNGQLIYDVKVGDNFESSPVVVGNAAVVGSRGSMIFKVHVQ